MCFSVFIFFVCENARNDKEEKVSYGSLETDIVMEFVPGGDVAKTGFQFISS